MLGVTLDTYLTFTQYCNNLTVKVQQSNNVLKALSGSTWCCDKEILLTTYQAIGEIALKNNHYYYYNELISQQFDIACHLPQHPCHQLCHRPPDDRPELRRSLIGQFKPNIQQYLAEEPLSNTSYMSAISSIHQDAVRTAIVSSSSKLLNGRPPPIATAEQTLPRKTRTILAQLCIGHSRILGQ